MFWFSHNSSFQILLQFEFLSCHNLSWVLSQFFFLVLSQWVFFFFLIFSHINFFLCLVSVSVLSFVTIRVFRFFFFTIWVFEFCHIFFSFYHLNTLTTEVVIMTSFSKKHLSALTTDQLSGQLFAIIAMFLWNKFCVTIAEKLRIFSCPEQL